MSKARVPRPSSVAHAAFKLLRALAHTLVGWLTIVWRFPRLSVTERAHRVQNWSRQMLNIMGIQLKVEGQLPRHGPLLLVSNHISWLDILVLHAVGHCRFVAKAQLQHWPVLGTMATGGQTLYIARESRRDARRMTQTISDSLRRSEKVAVFPEGTVSVGHTVLPFHANLIQAAIDANAPVLALALSYQDAATKRISLAPSYMDDTNLLGSVWNTLRAPALRALVQFDTPQTAQGRNRREWAAALRQQIMAMRA